MEYHHLHPPPSIYTIYMSPSFTRFPPLAVVGRNRGRVDLENCNAIGIDKYAVAVPLPPLPHDGPMPSLHSTSIFVNYILFWKFNNVIGSRLPETMVMIMSYIVFLCGVCCRMSPVAQRARFAGVKTLPFGKCEQTTDNKKGKAGEDG